MSSIQLLIVEDDFFVAEEIKTSIETLGFSVSAQVDNGKDAIQEVMDNKPDLAIMDIRIKGEMDGIETASRLAKDYGVPIIYMTDQSDEETYKKAKATSPHAFLQKPVTPLTLQRSIELAIVQVFKEQKEQEKDIGAGALFNKHYMLKNKDGLHAVDLKRIAYIEADEQYCKLYIEEECPVNYFHFHISRSMNKVIDSLHQADYCKDNLVRISKSHCVNLEKITKIKENKVFLGKQSYAIGVSYRDFLFKHIQKI